MPRPKRPVPLPKHVTPTQLAERAAKSGRRKLRVVAGTDAARALGIGK